MTQPSQPSPPDATPLLVAAVPAVVSDHDAEALALEDAAALATTGTIRDKLAGILQLFRLRWIREFGTLHTAASGTAYATLMADLARDLAQVRIDPAPVLLDYAQRATTLGVDQGFREAGHPAPPAVQRLPLAVHARIAGVAASARQQADAGTAMTPHLPPGTFNQTVLRAVAPTQQAANVLERVARTIANDRLNDGLGAAIDAAGAQRLWLAERDACLTCQALNGQVIASGSAFPDGTAFGGRTAQYAGETFDRPPAHEQCRCRITAWRGELTPDSLPMVLRREGERSVLRGWALPSESSRARTRAADALLTKISSRHGYAPSGWDVPDSVVRTTESRLKKGTFGVTPFPHRTSH